MGVEDLVAKLRGREIREEEIETARGTGIFEEGASKANGSKKRSVRKRKSSWCVNAKGTKGGLMRMQAWKYIHDQVNLSPPPSFLSGDRSGSDCRGHSSTASIGLGSRLLH